MQGFLFIGTGYEFVSYGVTVDEALDNYSEDLSLLDFRAILKV